MIRDALPGVVLILLLLSGVIGAWLGIPLPTIETFDWNEWEVWLFCLWVAGFLGLLVAFLRR